MAISGWDIGGAHLKVARVNRLGRLVQVEQFPCALWQGIEQLEQAILTALQQLDNSDDDHAVTMTGELADAFANREQGVRLIVQCVRRMLGSKLHIYASKQDWFRPPQAMQHWQQVASMNWQAGAILAASEVTNALFIDIGSTSCDIIPIINGSIAPDGLTDQQRQTSGELVYTGVVRTPLMAITDHAYINGQFIRLATEWFASSGDVWLLLDKLSASTIQDPSADGQPWSIAGCQRRLARMLGTDCEMLSDIHWQQLARWFAQQQSQQVVEACLQVLSRHPLLATAPIIGAGIGRFISQQCAQHLDTDYIDFQHFCQGVEAGAEHAPATALALLARLEFT